MKTLDISTLQSEQDYLDTSCPFCNGLGELENGEYCEECENGFFTIYWDMAFNVPYLSKDFDRARKHAFKHGWLLFEHDNEYWIAAGSCGYDFTWVRQSMILYLCGQIPIDYAESLSGGGYVFVSDSRKRTLIKETKKALYTQIRLTQMSIGDLNRIP